MFYFDKLDKGFLYKQIVRVHDGIKTFFSQSVKHSQSIASNGNLR